MRAEENRPEVKDVVEDEFVFHKSPWPLLSKLAEQVFQELPLFPDPVPWLPRPQSGLLEARAV